MSRFHVLALQCFILTQATEVFVPKQSGGSKDRGEIARYFSRHPNRVCSHVRRKQLPDGTHGHDEAGQRVASIRC